MGTSMLKYLIFLFSLNVETSKLSYTILYIYSRKYGVNNMHFIKIYIISYLIVIITNSLLRYKVEGTHLADIRIGWEYFFCPLRNCDWRNKQKKAAL